MIIEMLPTIVAVSIYLRNSIVLVVVDFSKPEIRDGIGLRPLFKDLIWSYDFVLARTAEGKVFRILNISDDYNRETYVDFRLYL